MEVHNRKMGYDDIEKILVLFDRLNIESAEVTFTNIKNKTEIEKWLSNSNYYLYVAEADGDIISIFRGIRGLEEESHCILITIATDLYNRSRGIAKNLILYSLKDIKEREKDVVLARSYVYSDNRASLNTMLSCGFTISGSVYQHHYDKKREAFIDDIILYKIL